MLLHTRLILGATVGDQVWWDDFKNIYEDGIIVIERTKNIYLAKYNLSTPSNNVQTGFH